MAEENSSIEKLAEMIKDHQHIVFFGGAGVSTESAIPDFRGKNGLYYQKVSEKWSPEGMLSHHFYREHPDLFFTMYKKMSETISHAEPNAAHRALAELEMMGKLSGVVTQNIDGLHQKAGSRNVVELHGSTLHNTCEKCRKQYDLPEFVSRSNPVPHCDCGGIIKPDIVLYEESLDINAIDDAVWLIRGADMLIIGGTSLAVYPAAGFINEFSGDALVIINRDATSKDNAADLVFRDNIGEVLGNTVRILRGE